MGRRGASSKLRAESSRTLSFACAKGGLITFQWQECMRVGLKLSIGHVETPVTTLASVPTLRYNRDLELSSSDFIAPRFQKFPYAQTPIRQSVENTAISVQQSDTTEHFFPSRQSTGVSIYSGAFCPAISNTQKSQW